MPPQPVYPYGAPPAYYGGFAPAPMYAAPPVYQPPPAYAPPPDPVQDPGMQNAQPPSPGYNDPAPLPDPAYSEGQTAGGSNAPGLKKTSTRLAYILPFGIGQFSQKRVGMGIFFAAAEVGLLYGAYYNMTAAADAQKKGNQEKDLCGQVECDEKQLQENIDGYQDALKQGNMLMTVCLIGAGVTAFAGAIEALMHAHDPSDSSKSRKKRGKGRPSKKRKYSGFTGVSPTSMPLPFSLLEDEPATQERAWTWDLKLSAHPLSGTRLARPSILDQGLSESQNSPHESSLTPSLLLDVTWTF
jgi:hypothetical protein